MIFKKNYTKNSNTGIKVPDIEWQNDRTPAPRLLPLIYRYFFFSFSTRLLYHIYWKFNINCSVHLLLHRSKNVTDTGIFLMKNEHWIQLL